MATLAFTVQADYDKLIALRNEITKLENQLKNLGSNTSAQAVEDLQDRLSSAKSSFTKLAGTAAVAGAQIQDDFKKKIHDASQAVFDFKEKIIAQKGVVAKVAFDVKKLSQEYQQLAKTSPMSAQGVFAELTAARGALDEEKAVLFDLTQQQAESALSVSRLKEEYKAFHEEAEGGENILDELKDKFAKITTVITAGMGLKSFVSQMIQVRSQFQAADTAIETMLGNKEKADDLMSKVREYAKISPLEFSDVTSATQMMLGFNIEAEKVPKFLSAIGDVSMGNSQKFNSLTLAFSQMSAAGKLMGQDLNQMINAGFNPLQTMSQTTGKSIAELKEQMSKGAVTAEMVQQAFIDATSAGGKFYQMSEKGAQTIQGQTSMLQDAMDAMFNELGTKSEGVIMDVLKVGTSLVQSYETVGKVVAGLIVTYGAYKTAVLVNIALEKLQVLSRAANIKHMSTMHLMTDILKAKTMALNKVLLENPYAIIAAGIAAVVAGVAIYASTVKDAASRQREFNSGMKDAQRNAYKEQSQLAALKGKLDATKKGTAEYKAVKDEIISQFGKYDENLSTEIEKVGLTKKKYDELAQSIQKAALARGYQKEMEKLTDAAADDLSKNLDTIKKKLVGKYGEEKGNNLFTKIQRSAVVEGKGWYKDETTQGFTDGRGMYHDGKTFRRLGGFDKEITDAINEVGDARDALYDIIKRREQDKNLDKDMRIKWGITDDALAKVKEEEKKEDDDGKKKNGNGGNGDEDKKEKERLAAEKKAGEELSKLKQANIDADIANDEEGREKQLRQIKNDWEKRKAEIIKQHEEFEELNEKAGKGKELTSEQKAEIDTANRLNDEDRKKAEDDLHKVDAEAMREYLKEYGDYEQQKLAITQEYEEKIAKATTEGGKMTLAKQRDEALQKLDFDSLVKSPEYIRAFDDLKNTSSETLQSLLEQFEKAKEQAAQILNPEDLQRYVDVINNITDELMGRDIFGTLTRNQQELAKAEKDVAEAEALVRKAKRNGGVQNGEVWLSATEAVELYNKALDRHRKAQNKVDKAQKEVNDKVLELVSAIKGVGSAIGGTAGEVVGLIGDVASFAITSVESIKTAGQTATGAMKAIEKASAILAVISTAIGILQSLSDLVKTDYERYLELAEKQAEINKLTDVVNAYRIAVLEAQRAEEYWFSENRLDALRSYRRENEEILNAYKDKLNETQAKYVNQNGGGWLITKNSMSPTAQEYVSARDNLRIETRKKSKGFLGTGIGGKSQKTEDLVNWAKKTLNIDLFNSDGMINQEAAKLILDKYNDKLVGETKATLESLMELGEQYEEYQQELQDYVSSLYEPLVDNVIDSMWAWFDEGKDALNSFQQAATDVFRSIANDMMREIVLKDIFGDYGNQVKELYNDYAGGKITKEQLMAKVGSLTADVQDRMEKGIPALQEIITTLDEAVEKSGFDLNQNESTSQSASFKNSTDMSEDTGKELNGRFAAVQIAAENSNETLLTISTKLDTITSSSVELRDIADDTRDIIAQSYLELQGIRENTEAVIKPIKQMAEDISTFKTSGMKMK